ncbi:MAG: hypothetical protein LBK22_03305, partial [Tannerella sp.]|nr:hypothetical protein [Tannerella sp.]
CYVTTLRLSAADVWRLYRGRVNCENLSKEAFAALSGKLKLYVRMLFLFKSQISLPQAKVSQKCRFNMKNVA